MESDAPKPELHYELLAWFEKNRQQVIYGTAAVLVVGVIVAFFLWRNAESKKEAGEALSKVFVPQVTSGANRPDAANAYLQVAKEHHGTEPAAQALLLAAGSLFEAGKYAEAQAQFEKFNREHRDNPFLAQGLYGLAATLEAQNKTNEALKAYQNLIDRRPGETVIPHAKYAIARIYDSENKPELAYPLYEDVARSDQFGSLGSYAGVRAEELRAKHPELEPPPITSIGTNAPQIQLLPATNTTKPPSSQAPATKK